MDFVCHRRCFVALPASLASLLCFVALLASLASLLCWFRCFASLLCFVALLASLLCLLLCWLRRWLRYFASLLCWLRWLRYFAGFVALLRCFASLLCWLRCFVCCFACFASCFSLKNAPTPKHTCQKPQVHTPILQLNDLKATERFMCRSTVVLYAHRSSTAEHFEDTTNTLTRNHIAKETPKTT